LTLAFTTSGRDAAEESIEARLLFIIAPPRSGSTLLMRVLSAHSQIYSRPEPHLLGPLAHLGYFATVDAAPFDQHQAASAIRTLVADLPNGEADYVDACRAYVDIIYGRLLAARGEGKTFFLDKTPANALVLPFITKLFPQAHYIVLARHPAAIFSSYANSFFAGDFAAAHHFNPILERYIPAMAWLMRHQQVPLLHVAYEDFVAEPDAQARRMCSFLGLEFEPTMIDYGAHGHGQRGLGDPLTVDRESRPVPTSVDKWVAELAADRSKLELVQGMLATIDPKDLETWGYPHGELFAALRRPRSDTHESRRWRLPQFQRFLWERRLLHWLRRDIETSTFGRWVRRLRSLCDILLRR